MVVALVLSLWLGKVNAQTLNQARSLTQQGRLLLDRSQPQAALVTWQQATKIYRQLRDSEGVNSSLLDESSAMQQLGLTVGACEQATAAVDLPSSICQSSFWGDGSTNELHQRLNQAVPSPLTLRGWQQLGNVLRHLGKLPESEMILTRSLEFSSSSELVLSLANTKRLLYRQSLQLYQRDWEPLSRSTALRTIVTQVESSLQLTKQISGLKGTGLLAKINHFSLLVEIASLDLPALKEIQQKAKAQIPSVLAELVKADLSSLPPATSIPARLKLANTLSKISPPMPSATEKAMSLTDEAIALASSFQSPRNQSQAQGTKGKLFFQSGRLEAAQIQLESALRLAQAHQYWDLAYQWQWQLGKLYASKGDLPKASRAYAAALDSLDATRGNILGGNGDLQFDFKERVEPVYLEYISLLLDLESKVESAIAVRSRLKIAELENFLQCGQLNLARADAAPDLKATTAIYLIDTGSSLEEIVRSETGLHRYTLNRTALLEQVENLKLNLASEEFINTPEPLIRSYGQQLYQQLIDPIEQDLPPSGHLVIAWDSPFDNLPPALLHDGTSYLGEKYDISLTLNTSVLLPDEPLSQKKTLIAGVASNSPSLKAPQVQALNDLSPLPDVVIEAKAIQQHMPDSTLLLDRDFTSDRFFQEIEKGDFSLVHLATHGQFSSDPRATAILAWDKPIDIKALNRLLTARQSPISLLTLSGCETAKGDRRSTLGLAGVAVSTRARSTLASLWRVESPSTALLMDNFYRGLSQGLTKAEALSHAQKTLRSNPGYSNPYYWAGWVLVGI